MSVSEIAEWLANEDGNGCTDEEFVECMVLFREICKRGNTDIDLSKRDIKEFDVKEFVDWLGSVLSEIIDSEEVCQSAWWKEE